MFLSGHPLRDDLLRPKSTAVRPKFRPWKSQGLPVFHVYACNCNRRRTLPEIYCLFLVCKPSLKLSTWQEVLGKVHVKADILETMSIFKNKTYTKL